MVGRPTATILTFSQKPQQLKLAFNFIRRRNDVGFIFRRWRWLVHRSTRNTHALSRDHREVSCSTRSPSRDTSSKSTESISTACYWIRFSSRPLLWAAFPSKETFIFASAACIARCSSGSRPSCGLCSLHFGITGFINAKHAFGINANASASGTCRTKIAGHC